MTTPHPTREANARRQLTLLGELAEIGMRMARELDRRMQAPEGDDDLAPLGNDPALTYARLTRAVRLTLAMETHILDGLESAATEVRRKRAASRRGLVERVVEAAVEAEVAGEDDQLALMAEVTERLWDDEDIDLDRPVGETIARICADLGLAPDWGRWAMEPWALEEARTGAHGSPFAEPPFAQAAAGEAGRPAHPGAGWGPELPARAMSLPHPAGHHPHDHPG